LKNFNDFYFEPQTTGSCAFENTKVLIANVNLAVSSNTATVSYLSNRELLKFIVLQLYDLLANTKHERNLLQRYPQGRHTGMVKFSYVHKGT